MLTSRQDRERKFHNEWAQSINSDDLLIRESFESPTALENRFVLKQMGSIRGKKILDLGCGAGETSIYFALQGAEVTASDISEGMITVVTSLAKKYNVQLHALVSPSELLPLPDENFDFVFGNGVLHHVDLGLTMKEIRRILKPGGRAFFIEPLPYNPIINIYRKIAKEIRTEDEKPFHFSSMKLIKQYFPNAQHQEFWLFTLVFFMYFYISGVDPNKERYWKKIIKDGYRFKKSFAALNKLDEIITKIPFVGRLCWNTVLMLKK